MPFRSKAQKGYLAIHEPKIFERWIHKYGGKIVPSKKHKKALKKK
jgi:hypothetical protein